MTNKCLICQSEAFLIKQKNAFDIFKCTDCMLEFTLPMPSEDCLAEFYSNYHDIRAHDDVTKLNATRNLAFIERYLSKTNKAHLLDYGCGNNSFIRICRESGYVNSYGYDKFLTHLSEQHISSAELQQKKWQVITLWGVLEHLTSPIEELKAIAKLLDQEGTIVLTTIYIDALIPFQYKPPEHTLYFSEQSLNELAQKCGLKICAFENYRMKQNADVYLSILHRTMPEEYKQHISHSLPKFVDIPTNEVRVVLKKLS